jgi:hypothetical protein
MVSNEFIPAVPDPVKPPLPRPNRAKKGVQDDIAAADKIARTGSSEEKVRDTPPSGAWNDTSHD